jgi:DNA polymerase-3 subunit chi
VTRVDFYVLSDAGERPRLSVACRLADKAYRLGHRVYLHAASAAAARELDELLWTFRADSFVPHRLLDDGGGDPVGLEVPVVIGAVEEPEDEHCDLLINTAAEVPLFFSRYERVAEIVPGDEDERRRGRMRYQFYRERGYPLHTHEL